MLLERWGGGAHLRAIHCPMCIEWVSPWGQPVQRRHAMAMLDEKRKSQSKIIGERNKEVHEQGSSGVVNRADPGRASCRLELQE